MQATVTFVRYSEVVIDIDDISELSDKIAEINPDDSRYHKDEWEVDWVLDEDGTSINY